MPTCYYGSSLRPSHLTNIHILTIISIMTCMSCENIHCIDLTGQKKCIIWYWPVYEWTVLYYSNSPDKASKVKVDMRNIVCLRWSDQAVQQISTRFLGKEVKSNTHRFISGNWYLVFYFNRKHIFRSWIAEICQESTLINIFICLFFYNFE